MIVCLELTLCWNDLDFNLLGRVRGGVQRFIFFLQRWSIWWTRAVGGGEGTQNMSALLPATRGQHLSPIRIVLCHQRQEGVQYLSLLRTGGLMLYLSPSCGGMGVFFTGAMLGVSISNPTQHRTCPLFTVCETNMNSECETGEWHIWMKQDIVSLFLGHQDDN